MTASGNHPSTYPVQSLGFGRLIKFFCGIRGNISADLEQRTESSSAGFLFASDMNEASLTETEILYISLTGMCL
jgi:hypothetical protein